VEEYAVPTLPSRDLHEITNSARCFAWVHDVDALYAESEGSGATEPPVDTDYDVRRFTVTDPSGNRISFGTGPH
jgi:hypothetical protein